MDAAVIGLVKEALDEDARAGGKFDAEGFSNFFPEDDPDQVRLAWVIYDEIRNGGMKLEDFE
jgi:hypothetical protein